VLSILYQSYSGRVRNGQPYISDAIRLPEDASLIITVLSELPLGSASDNNQSMQNDSRQSHRAAFEDFFSAMAEINDEPLDDAFDAILAKRINITRELDL